MTLAAPRKPLLSAGARVVFGSSLLLGALVAATTPAAAAESPTAVSSTSPVVKGSTGRQLWRISDYTTVELVAREPGTPENQHPFALEQNTLHAWLQQVQLVRDGTPRPLFAIDELRSIVPALAEALAHARADQDVALVSSARHEDNTFYSITAVTARLFAADGHLNLIVHDARNDFYDATRGSGMAPRFTVGSRTAPGSAQIASPTATNKRGDWLVLDTVAPAAPASPAVPAAPVSRVAPAAVAPAGVAPVAAPPAPAAVPMAPPAPAAVAPAAPIAPVVTPAANDAEQRLLTAKRLYDKGLINKAEYEKKRAEIIKGL
jgi:hypothetical protein